MIVLIDGVRYRLRTPENEAVLEKWIEGNYRYIFGEKSFYFPKKKIQSKARIGTFPDAYLIIFDGKPKWCILEVELASHSVYDHVFPQLTKFRRAVESGTSRKKIADFFYDTIKDDAVLEAMIKKEIGSGEIHKFVSDLVAERPMIVVAIDEKTPQLEEALLDFGGDVKVVEFKTFQREGISDEINAFVFEPVVRDRGKSTIIQSGASTGKSQRGQVDRTIYKLFDEKGVDKVSYEECEALAKQVKPDTAFNKNHFSWYKNHYRKNPVMVAAGKKAAITRATGSYTFKEHLVGKPDSIRNLAIDIQEYTIGLGPLVEEKAKKFYIAYRISQNFVCMEIRKQKIILFLKLKPNSLENVPDIGRDVSNIGHYGTGDFEMTIKSQADFEIAKQYIQLAYQKVGG